MSWSVGNIKASMTEDVGAAIDKQLESITEFSTPGPQLQAAREAVLALITAVARPEDDLVINMSGHYNEDLNPKEGWADCFITVTVSQRPNKSESV